MIRLRALTRLTKTEVAGAASEFVLLLCLVILVFAITALLFDDAL